VDDPLDITNKDELLAQLAAFRKGKARSIAEEEMKTALKWRVRGQDHIVDPLCKFVRLQWGKEQRSKPIANLLFVGPPATGKTELANAMTEYLIDDEKHMLRFDCAEFGGAEGKTRLVGTPTGYVGASQGGQLTRPMLSNPRRLVLFDEIEKLNASVIDLMLSLMGEGRLTEQGSGKAADFTQSIIVLTSNAEHEAMGKLVEQFDDPHALESAVRSVLRESKTFRPEIVSRFDHIFVFKPLDDETRARVAALKVIKAGEEYGVKIKHVELKIVLEIVMIDGEQDAREIARRVDMKLGEVLLAAKEKNYREITIDFDENGKLVANPVVDEE